MPRNMQPPAQAEIRPVYPAVLTGEPDPQAKAFCVAIHELPAQKRARAARGPWDGADRGLHADADVRRAQ